MYTSLCSCHESTYFSLRTRQNLLYDTTATSSPKLLYQLDQLDQVLVTKETSTTGHCHKWIFRHYRCPARWNRAQTTLGIVEIDSIFAPVVAVGDQLKLLASQRMMRVDNVKASVDMVGMLCS
jgi:hypothetical protein